MLKRRAGKTWAELQLSVDAAIGKNEARLKINIIWIPRLVQTDWKMRNSSGYQAGFAK
jgi:hypothetical protein